MQSLWLKKMAAPQHGASVPARLSSARLQAPLWPARQAALWHASEQKRAMSQPEHRCSRRPASVAPDRLQHLRA